MGIDGTLEQSQYWFWSIIISALSVFASALVTITVLFLSARLNRRLKTLELDRKSADRIAEIRANLFDNIRTDLNDIFTACYLVGQWRTFQPQELLAKKRMLDQKMIESLPLWGGRVIKAYKDFMEVCFQIKGGRNTIPLLRADIERYRQENDLYSSEWDVYFMEKGARDEWVYSKIKGKERVSYRNDILRPAFIALNFEIAQSTGSALSKEEIEEALE